MGAPIYLFVHKDYPIDTDGVNSGAETATLWLARTLAACGKRVVLAAQLKRPECEKWGVSFWNLGESYDVAGALARAAKLGTYRLFAACRAWPLTLGCADERCISTHLMAHDPSAGALGISPKLLNHYADSVFCVSKAQAQLFIKEGCPEELIAVLPNGANREVFAPVDFAQRDLNRIVFAGALVMDKGIDILLRAFAALKQTHPNATLDVYGSSSMWGREPLFDQAQLQRAIPGLKFHGAVSQDAVAHAFQTAAFTVIPSRWFDSFPLAAVEAESTGCPVIAFDVGGMREAIIDGESGVIIPEVSEGLLVTQMQRMLSDRELLKRLSDGAERLVTERFNWLAIAERLIANVEKSSDSNTDSDVTATPRKGPVCLISTWNQNCGLATYARYLWGEQLSDGALEVLSERGVETLSPDERYVERCWTRKDLSGLRTALAARNPGVIHLNLHSVDFLPVPQLCAALRDAASRGTPIVAHLHSTFAAHPDFPALAELVDLFIVHDQQNRLELLSQGARRVAVLPHGIDVKQPASEEQVRATRAKLGVVSADERLLVCFGFVQPHKGIEALLEAVAHLRSKGIAARGAVVGQVNERDPNAVQYRAALREYAQKLGVSGLVRFTDRFVSNDEVTAALQAADLVVMNYQSKHFEASGACSLAIGAGASVISSLAPMFNSFGAATWRATAGFPVPVAAERILSSDAAKEALIRGVIEAQSTRAWPKVMEQLLSIYQTEVNAQPTRNDEAVESKKLKPSAGTPVASPLGSEKSLKVLIQNRPNTFTQRGGDTVVIERTVAGLRALGIECTVDVAGTANVKDFDVVHIFNFALPELTKHFAQGAVSAGVPFVVTTLNEDLPSFHSQSVLAAQALTHYVQNGQDPRVWAQLRQRIDSSPPTPPFDNSWTVEHAAALLTNGKRESESLRKQYPGSKSIIEVPLGFEVTELGVTAQLFISRYGLRDFVLCVGRLESRKNQLMLLKALENEDVPVVFVSGGFTYQPEYAAAIRGFRRKGRTLVLDRLEPEMLASAYRAAKVHVLPSWYELPGLVSLEAGALGCNLVVTDNGTTRDYLGDFAEYCRPSDELSIRDAVLTALKRPRPSGLIEHLTSYRWERTARETKQVYEAVLGIPSPIHAVKLTQEGNMTTQTPTMWPNTGASNLGVPGVGMPTGAYDMSSESTDFLTLVERGELEAKNGRLDAAHKLLEQAEMINPTSVRLMKARGTVFLAESKNEIASHYFERAQRSDPKDARVLIGLGMVSSRKGETRKAHEMFANALRLSPDTTVGIMQLVGTSYALEEFGDLERCLRQYLHLKPEEIEMQYCLAGCLLRTGGLAESESICVGILKRDPSHKNARELLDIIHARHPQTAEVSTVTTTAAVVESKPRLVEVDTILGKLEEHKRRKEYDQLSAGVVELLARTDLVNDQRELALCLKAESLVMDDDIAGAERTFQEVLELNANSPRGLSGKAVLKAHLGSWMEAQNLFERARSLKEDYDLALAGLGICALQANDLETAWARFSAALKSNPENTRALLGLVQLAYPMKRFEELELAIRSYLDIHSADLEWVYSLAGVCFAQGKLDDAQSAVEQIKLFRPNDAKANELAQMIEQRR